MAGLWAKFRRLPIAVQIIAIIAALCFCGSPLALLGDTDDEPDEDTVAATDEGEDEDADETTTTTESTTTTEPTTTTTTEPPSWTYETLDGETVTIESSDSTSFTDGVPTPVSFIDLAFENEGCDGIRSEEEFWTGQVNDPDVGQRASAYAQYAQDLANEHDCAPPETLSQSNARRAANDYLDYTAFSRQGLIDQLEYEGYSTEDATYAVDAISPDWNEQAARAAQQYLDYTSFSRQSLIEQLKYDGFTQEEAEHGATAVGY